MPKYKKPRITPIDAKIQEPLKSNMARIFPTDRPTPHLYLSVENSDSLYIDMIDMGIRINRRQLRQIGKFSRQNRRGGPLSIGH
jgi:hypothetical protein